MVAPRASTSSSPEAPHDTRSRTPLVTRLATVNFSYERLDDKAFQRLCQSALSETFPGVQCLPLGQKDGGRDAVLDGGTHVFQVKHTQRVESVPNAATWILAAVRGELDNIERLYNRGCRKYTLICNLSSTAAVDAGTFDQVNADLDALLSPKYPQLAVTVWWRETLDAYVTSNIGVQWSFPAMLNGAQVASLLLRTMGAERAEQRARVIRSFLGQQYDLGRALKFKQVGLESASLTDLFVDVPAALTNPGYLKSSPAWRAMADDLTAAEQGDDSHFVDRGDRYFAADLLLAPKSITRVVINGGPGQGKSTLLQYLCQLHASRLLGEPLSADARHLAAPMRLPILIDLKGFSAWRQRTSSGAKSLEQMIVQRMQAFSGGEEFSISDLWAVVRETPVLLALDALDEVGDPEERKGIVAAIEETGERLARESPMSQVIITSRPLYEPLSEDQLSPARYLELSLARLPFSVADKYLQKWIAARGLSQVDAEALSGTWQDRRGDGHVLDLSQNLMQVSILFHLINARGLSLPSQRTVLYDEYMRMFLDREAEKDARVAQYRDLLHDLHGYIAFWLHARADSEHGSGSVSAPDLQVLISDYLRDQGREGDVEQLFVGVQRVVALVSNVDGLFEFEVQPLREYFAAKFLYTTAPFAYPGEKTAGQRHDRLFELLQRPFWNNVLRFFVGCFQLGELSGLVDLLVESAEADSLALPLTARRNLLTFVADGIFAERPKTEKRALEFCFDATGRRAAITFYDSDALTAIGSAQASISMATEFLRRVVATTDSDLYTLRAVQRLVAERRRSDIWASVRSDAVSDSHWLAIGNQANAMEFLPSEAADEIWSSIEATDQDVTSATLGGLPITGLLADEIWRHVRIAASTPLKWTISRRPKNEATAIIHTLSPAAFYNAEKRFGGRIAPGTPIARRSTGTTLTAFRNLVSEHRHRTSHPTSASVIALNDMIGGSWQGTMFGANVMRTMNGRLEAWEATHPAYVKEVEAWAKRSRAEYWLGEFSAVTGSADPVAITQLILRYVLYSTPTSFLRAAEAAQIAASTLPQEWMLQLGRACSLGPESTRGGPAIELPSGSLPEYFAKAPDILWLVQPRTENDARTAIVSRLAHRLLTDGIAPLSSAALSDTAVRSAWRQFYEGAVENPDVSEQAFRAFRDYAPLRNWLHIGAIGFTRRSELPQRLTDQVLEDPASWSATICAVAEQASIGASGKRSSISRIARDEAWFVDAE
jgi:hypothetical protein